MVRILLHLEAKTTIDTFPSKIYTVFVCGKSVVARADPGSELEATIVESGCGTAIPPFNTTSYTAAILNAYERRAELSGEGGRGRDYVERGFSKEAIAAQYEDANRRAPRKAREERAHSVKMKCAATN